MSWSRTNATSYRVEYSVGSESEWKAAGECLENEYTIKAANNSKVFLRVCGMKEDIIGEYSKVYPAYITSDVPLPPVGLNITESNGIYRLHWGEVLGVNQYRLYKKGDCNPVYEGEGRTFITTDEGEYYVTSVSPNGESRPSCMKNTADKNLTRWDNRPEEKFRRDTRSFEFGYEDFDFLSNDNNEILFYPE